MSLVQWVMLANSNGCRIYERKKHKKYHLIKEINHPENKLRTQDLVTDKPGHYKTRTKSRGAFAPHSDPSEVLIENFAREIASKLNKWRHQHCYDDLVFMLPATMEGRLFKYLNKDVQHRVQKIIQKNIMKYDKQRMMHYVQAHA